MDVYKFIFEDVKSYKPDEKYVREQQNKTL